MAGPRCILSFLVTVSCLLTGGPRGALTMNSNDVCNPDPLAPRLLVIGLDGVRWDQVLGSRYPGFANFIKSGVRAEYMEPVFPTNTYVNFYTLATGLWPESSGMVDNFMYDGEKDATFWLGERSSDYEPFWWKDAEPIWISATKQRLVSHLHYWPGCEAKFKDIAPGLCHPYEASLTLANFSTAIAEVLEGFQHGCVQFAAVYTPNTDFIGHDHGPDSEEMKDIIGDIDDILADMAQKMDSLQTPDGQRLSEVVNIIIVSDHGMASTHPSNVVPLYKYVDVSSLDRYLCRAPMTVCHFWPKQEQLDDVYAALSAASHVRLYKKSDIPERFHGTHHRRVAPLVAVADVGWMLGPVEKKDHKENALFGHHGYEPTDNDMRALFLASGPSFHQNHVHPHFSSVDVYQLMSHLLGISPQPHNGTWSHVADMLRR